MKKVLFAICAVLPGGFVILAVMVLFVGCAHFQAQSQGFKIEGRTNSPETMMLADAEAYATKRCADYPERCYMGMWSSNFMDTTTGLTWAGIQAAGVYGQQGGGAIASPQEMKKEVMEISKDIKRIKNSQGLLIRALQNSSSSRKTMKSKKEITK